MAALAAPALLSISGTLGSWAGAVRAPAASLIGGGFLPLLGRLLRRNNPKSEQAQDLKDIALTGFILEKIADDISCQMNEAVTRYARELDWPTVYSVTQKLIVNQITMGRIARVDGEKTVRIILDMAAQDEPDLDEIARYRALSQIIEVVPFGVFQSFVSAQKKP